ncbi:MAG: cytochrome b5-like heme/steroid binding domain-containing protein [Candidatus Woesearchaeota archaeon]
MKIYTILGLLLFVALVITACTPKSQTDITTTESGQQATGTMPATENPTSTTTQEDTYTLQDVQTHGTSDACWSAVTGVVYDLTPWIKQHPGGSQNIINMCGKDATQAFLAQHGGQGKPERTLNGFEIGTLA